MPVRSVHRGAIGIRRQSKDAVVVAVAHYALSFQLIAANPDNAGADEDIALRALTSRAEAYVRSRSTFVVDTAP
jgi:hypothetical protein